MLACDCSHITCDEMAQKQPLLQQTIPQKSGIFGAVDAVDAVTMYSLFPRILSVNSVSEGKMSSAMHSVASHSAGVSTSHLNNPPEVRHLLLFSFLVFFSFHVMTHSFFLNS